MMRKCELRMQENPKLLQSEYERSEALGSIPKHSNLSPAHLNPNPLAKTQFLGPSSPRPCRPGWKRRLPQRSGARLTEEAHALSKRRTPYRRGACLTEEEYTSSPSYLQLHLMPFNDSLPHHLTSDFGDVVS